MLIKTAKVQIYQIGYLKDLKADLKKDEFWSEFVDQTMAKTAALQPIARYLDDFIYTRQRAISAFEVHGFNGNKDAFRRAELQKAYPTFINTGFYKDHRNWDKRFAYGINLDARYHPGDFVEVISAVAKSWKPDSDEVVRNILAGKWCETSMGAEVQVSECSICGCRATREAEFCDHIRYMKGAKIDGKDVFEYNEGLNFFDDSIITTEAAEREALITEVFTPEELAKKASKEHPVWNIIRTPHLDVKVCTNCKESIKPSCKGDGSCGHCKSEASAQLVEPAQKDPSAMISNGSVVGVHSGDKSGASAPIAENNIPKEGVKMETPAIQKQAEDAGAKPTVGDKERISQQPSDRAEEYKRAKEPFVAAAEEAKKPSDATSKEVVGKPEQVSQQSDAKDYPHEGSIKSGSRVSKALAAMARGLLHLAGEDSEMLPAESPKLNVEIKDLESIKDHARSGVSTVQDALTQVDQAKSMVLSRIHKTKLASIRKRAEEELKELQSTEKDLVEEKQTLEQVIVDINKFEEDVANGKSSLHADDIDSLRKDVADAVADAQEAVKDILTPEAPKSEKKEEKADEKKEPKEDKKEEKAEEKKEEKAEEKEEKKEKEASLAKKGEEAKAPEGKQEAGNPQLMIDREKDYVRSPDPHAEQSGVNKSQDSTTRSEIDKQRDTGFATPAEQVQQREIRMAANRFYRGLREAGLKHATASRKVRSWVKDFRDKLAKLAAAPSVEDLKKQIVDEVSEQLVSEILDTRPESADVSQVGAPPTAATPEEQPAGQEEMFGTPPVTVSSSKVEANNHKEDCDCVMCKKMEKKDKEAAKKEAQGDPKSSETPGPKASGELPADPAAPGWDLFPDDRVTGVAAGANSEQESALREEMKGVYVPESVGGEAKFRGQIDPKTLKAKGSQDVSKGEQQKMAEALELASEEVQAGLIDESQLEMESKRLFLMTPSELQATAEMVTRTKKLAMRQHPDANDPSILKSALMLGPAAGDGLDGNLFDD